MLRLIVAMPFALVISIGLFMFMAWMVDSGHQRTPEQGESLSFNMVMVEQEATLQRRQRSVPEPPQMPESPPTPQVSQSQTQTAVVNSPLAVADLGLNTVIDGLAINMPSFEGFGSNQQAIPLYRSVPRYPAKALKRKKEGFVDLIFTIDKTGRPIDIKVTNAEPKRLFDRSAKAALKKWKYQPKVLDGQAVEQVGQTVTIEFKMEK